MTTKRDYTDYLRDLLHYSAAAQRFVAGVDFDAFADNEEKVLAVVHALQIVGEAAQKLPGSLTRRHPEVPWAEIVGMRNFIVHGYYMVDVEIVWKTIKEDLPPMQAAVQRLLEESTR
jgi:uncharacterized protein with HEPN domain